VIIKSDRKHFAYIHQTSSKMKKYLFILILIAGIITAQSCSKINGENSNTNSESSIPELLSINTNVGLETEREALLTAYDKAILTLKTNPQNLKAYLTLAQVFITEARLSGNTGYYNVAAVKMIDHVLEQKSTDKDINFEALTLKAGVLLSMHQFKDALDVANAAYKISEHNAQILGALVDANVELGNYAVAVQYCDKMVQLRPDIRSYSRVSYLRQIHGDNAGAIEAMKMAVEAGLPGAESTEWARVVLGDLLLMTGDINNATICYETALGLRKNYPYAEAGLGRLEKTKKNYAEAIKHTENAINTLTDVAFVNQLAEIYALKGDNEKAEEIYEDVVDLLEKGEKEQNKEDALVKHNGSRELASAYSHTNELGKALKNAQEDLALRPLNNDANELIAWIYYLDGDYTNAKMHADKMLSTNTKNPTTLYKAGLIYTKSGDTEKGKMLIAEAKEINVSISESLFLSSK